MIPFRATRLRTAILATIVNPTPDNVLLTKGGNVTPSFTSTTGKTAVAWFHGQTYNGTFNETINGAPAGNTWVTMTQKTDNGDGFGYGCYYCVSWTGGANHILTFNPGGASNSIANAGIIEFGHVPSAGSLIASSIAITTGQGTTYPGVTSTLGAPYGSNKLYACSIMLRPTTAQAGGAPVVYTVDDWSMLEQDGQEDIHYNSAIAGKVVNGTGAQTATWRNSKLNNAADVFVTFMMQGGLSDGPVTPPPEPPTQTPRFFTAGAVPVSTAMNKSTAIANNAVIKLSTGDHGTFTVTQSNRTIIGVPGLTKRNIVIAPGVTNVTIRGGNGNITFQNDGRAAKTSNVKIECNQFGDIVWSGAWLENCEFTCNAFAEFIGGNSAADRCKITGTLTLTNPTNQGAGTYSGDYAIRMVGDGGGKIITIGSNTLDDTDGGMRFDNFAELWVVGHDEECSRPPNSPNPYSISVKNIPRAYIWGAAGRPVERRGLYFENTTVTVLQFDLNITPGYVTLATGGTVSYVPANQFVKSNVIPAGITNTNTMPAGANVVGLPTIAERPVTLLTTAAFAGMPDQRAEVQAALNAAVDGGFYEFTGYKVIYGKLRIPREVTIIGPGAGLGGFVQMTPGEDVFDTNFGAPAGPGATMSNQFNAFDFDIIGGTNGFHLHEASLQLTRFIWGGLVFHGQSNAGWYVDDCYAIDNAYILDCTYKSCGSGTKQRTTSPGGDTATMAYIDKLWSIRCQYLDCGIPIDWVPNRGDYLDGDKDCVFARNSNPPNTGNNAVQRTYMNCNFVSNGGTNTIAGGSNSTVVVDCKGIVSLPANILS